MIIHISQNSSENQIDEITQFVESMGLNVHRSNGSNRIILGLTGDVSKIDINTLKKYNIVEDVYRITAPYKKANREFHEADSVIDIGDGVKVGGDHFLMCAGPCSVENETDTIELAKQHLQLLKHTHIFDYLVYCPIHVD